MEQFNKPITSKVICSLDQPTTASVSITIEKPISFVSLLRQIFSFFYNLAFILFLQIVIFVINW